MRVSDSHPYSIEEKDMKFGKDRKIEIQGRIIADLQDQNQLLKEENQKLKADLAFERIKPREGYQEAKKMMAELEKSKAEYDKLIFGMKERQKKCEDLIKTLQKLKGKYKKKMDDVIASFS